MGWGDGEDMVFMMGGGKMGDLYGYEEWGWGLMMSLSCGG